MNKPIVTMTHEAWLEEGARRFGPDHYDWRFVCPSCGHVASVREWREAGASSGEVAFSCIGRRLGADGSNTFKHAGGPCDYTSGGLICIAPLRVVIDPIDEPKGMPVFAFADEP